MNLTKILATCDAIDRVISRELLSTVLYLATITDKTKNQKYTTTRRKKRATLSTHSRPR